MPILVVIVHFLQHHHISNTAGGLWFLSFASLPQILDVSWCCGNCCWFTFALWYGYYSMSFQSFALHHLVFEPPVIPRNFPDLNREIFHSFPSSDFLVVFSYSFALEKRFSANVCKSGNYKGDKNKISDSQSESSKTFHLSCHRCICCGSILSLVWILFPFVFGYGNVW